VLRETVVGGQRRRLGRWHTKNSAREGPVIALAREEEAGEMMEAVTEPVVDKSWQDFANCLGVDPDLFFPERGASTREAKEVCRGCVVREDCLEYALANGEKFGIWGGMSERERRRIRRQRALARAAAEAKTASA
jgi:WhiB family redox-sensing transcriptional regulator